LGPEYVQSGDEGVVSFGDHYVFIGEAIVPKIKSGRLETASEDGLIGADDYTIL